MSLATALPLTIGQEILDGTGKSLVQGLQSEEGLTAEDAKALVKNFFIDLATNTAFIATALTGKLGVKLASFLGLEVKNMTKATLSPAAQKVATKITGAGAVASGKALGKWLLKSAVMIAAPVWLIKAAADVIEPGIYKPEQTNAVYAKLGIPFKYPVAPGSLKPGPFDVDAFKDYANALEASGIGGFEYGFPIGSIMYSRQALADLVDYVYGQQVIKGYAPSAKQLIPLLAPYLVRSGGGTLPSVTLGSSLTAPSGVSGVKVFTGLVSQGTLGAGLTFIPREDDIIDSAADLQDAAQNNLASYLVALPSKIIYEVKIVSSVTTKDGFRQVGASQQIVSGIKDDGTPRYRTVVNKFAVLNLYILTDRGGKSKLASIVLGPTDAVKLQLKQSDLVDLERNIQKSIFTSDLNAITGVKTEAGVVSVQPDAEQKEGIITAPAAVVATWDQSKINFTGGTSIFGKGLDQSFMYQGQYYSVLIPEGYVGTVEDAAKNELVRLGVILPKGVKAPDPNRPGQNALTLYDWYQANGQQLPSVEQRSRLYAEYGLGQASMYTGTAEQNTKLLDYLKTGATSG